MLLKFIGVSLFLVLSFSLQAQSKQSAYLAELISQANEKKLAQHQEWLNLLHYKANTFSGYTSHIISKEFFNAEDGMTDPASELESTLASFFSDLKETDKQQNPQCHYISRFYWLHKQLNFDFRRMKRHTCDRFDKWLKAINPEQMTLIFPAGTDNSPASMFGHTLFRIDKVGQTEKSRLFSYSLNFAAETDETNGLIFAFRGIFGGYPGRFSIMPYYEKVKQYNDMEHRDIWEYQLNLTHEEIIRILQHAWELGSADFAYYFFLENCSYQLLALLDVARPGLSLADRFSVWALPGDTVSVILEEENILKKTTFRASVKTRIKHQISYLDGAEKNLVLDIINHKINPDSQEIAALPVEKKALVLITAYDYLQYLSQRGGYFHEDTASRSLSLLRARNKVPVTETIPPVPVPAVRFDEGHGTSRFAIGGGSIKQDNVSRDFSELKFRPAYHGLLDLQDGYTGGAQINFGDITLRHDAESDKTRLHEFMLIDIFSLTRRDQFFKPLSWKINTGFVRRPIDNNYEERLVYSVNGGFGLSFSLTDNMSAFTMLDVTLLLHDKLQEKIAIGAGPSVGVFWRATQNWSIWLSGNVQYFDESLELNYIDYRFEQNIAFSTNTALRVSAIERGKQDDSSKELSASFNWYFK